MIIGKFQCGDNFFYNKSIKYTRQDINVDIDFARYTVKAPEPSDIFDWNMANIRFFCHCCL